MKMFADAIEDYYSYNLKSSFVFYKHCLQKKYNGIKIIYDLGIYFRSWDKLDRLEKKIINLSYGNILDIGSCTGYYIPYLMNKGPTTGIELSSKINNIARKKGLDNCISGDFLKYKFNKTFDTITLFGNDIALSGSLFNLKKILKKFKKLLNHDGQVLLIISHIRTLKYWHVIFTPKYEGHFGIPFKLLFFNTHFFNKFAAKYGFYSSILGKSEMLGDLSYLVRLVKLS